MRKIAESSHTGSDRILFYEISSECGEMKRTAIRVIHLQEWSDLVGEIDAEDMEKYNVVAHDICTYGYDGQVRYANEDPHDYSKDGVGIGESVHDSLRSCGWSLTQGEGFAVTITQPYDGTVIAQGVLSDLTVALVIAEAMYGYGAGDRAHDESGNNARELLKSARNA